MKRSIQPDDASTIAPSAADQDGALPPVRSVPVWRPGLGEEEDRVVTEEPLEIRIDGRPWAVTLRTPGEEAELAIGFLVSEGVVAGIDAIASVRRVDQGPSHARGNTIDVRLKEGVRPGRAAVDRPSLVSSACGVCGKTTLDAVRRRAPMLADGPQVEAEVLRGLPAALRRRQLVFDQTGGLHAAGLFTVGGELVAFGEDVGRHNAVDKVIGRALTGEGTALSGNLLVVSGRLGFEIAQKAWMVGIPLVASISAPSHLAVELAGEAGMTLVAFLRDDGMNVYAGRERIRHRE